MFYLEWPQQPPLFKGLMLTKSPLNEQGCAHSHVDLLLSEVEKRIEGVSQKSAHFHEPDLIDARTAAAYHFSVIGKRLRARLAINAGVELGLSDNDMVCIASAVELLHNASLIHDDIQDRDLTRRQQPSVWKKFNKNIAICSGDLLLSSAYSAISGIDHPEKLAYVLPLIHERTATTICGQCADLAWSVDTLSDLPQYIKIAGAKSGALLSLPLELALTLSIHAQACSLARVACEHFSVSYQIADDLDDLSSSADPLSPSNVPAGLNIVCFLIQGNSRSYVVREAVNLALQHLELCRAAAAKLPLNTGAALLSLAAGLQQNLEKKLLKEPSK